MSKQSSNEGQALWPNDLETGRAECGFTNPKIRKAVWTYVFDLTAAYDAAAAEAAQGSEEARARKAGIEAELARWLGLADRMQERIPRSLFQAYEPMLHKATRQVAGSDPTTSFYEDVFSDLRVVFARVLRRYDPDNGLLAPYLWTWLKLEARQSASRFKGYDDAARRHYRAIGDAVQHLTQKNARTPRIEEIASRLAEEGISIDAATIRAVLEGGFETTERLAEHTVGGESTHEVWERLDALRREYSPVWRVSSLKALDVFLVVAKSLLGFEDSDLSAWASGADGGTLLEAMDRTCNGLGCTWPEVLDRLGVPATLQKTPTALLVLHRASGASSTAEALGRRRRRKEALLREAKARLEACRACPLAKESEKKSRDRVRLSSFSHTS